MATPTKDTRKAVSAVCRPPLTQQSVSLPYACRCGTRWGGSRTCHCPACHRTFSTVGNFDLHRRGAECLDPAGIRDSHGQPRLEPSTSRPGIWVGAGEPADGWERAA